VRDASWPTVIEWFVPAGHGFYRPLYLVVLWGAHSLLGTDPLGYHLIAWLAHVSAAFLLSLVALAVTGERVAAAVAGLTFLWSIHAHEVIFDVATLHHTLGGVTLLVAVLAWMRGARGVALLSAAIGLLVNELALLTLPILCAYELWRSSDATLASRGRQAAGRLAPQAALAVAYFVLRLVVAGADLPREGATCLTVRCLGVAMAEYTNRLLVRPEGALSLAWKHRLPLAAVTILLAIALGCVLRPRQWRRWNGAGFAASWLLIAVTYLVVSLWPYISDRFLYVPDMGLAILVGWVAGEGCRAWPRSSPGRRLLESLALTALLSWVALGGIVLYHRGGLWSAAGRDAARIVEAIHACVPVPPPAAAFCVVGPVDSASPGVPPGNTGPYLFRNGLASALRMRYERPDLTVVRDCAKAFAAFSVSQAPLRIVRQEGAR